MGAARFNPNSPQFRQPLKENDLSAQIVVQTVASQEWLDANPGADPKTCPIEHTEASYQIFSRWMFPSNLARNEPHKWPGYNVWYPIAELYRVPVLKLYKRTEVEFAARGLQPPPPLRGDDEPPLPLQSDPAAAAVLGVEQPPTETAEEDDEADTTNN